MPHLVRVLSLTLACLLVMTRAHALVDTTWADGSGVDIEIRSHQVYRTASGQNLTLDLYLPFDRSKEPVPLIVYMHGGGWIAGSRDLAPLRLLPFLQMGWAAANVSYRLGTTAPAPAAVEDVRCALRWLHARSTDLRVDPQRVVLAGGSAGGHLALMAGLLPSGNRFDRSCPTEGASRWNSGIEPPLKVAAVLNWFGITDVGDLLAGPNAKHYAIEWFGAMPEAERATLARDVSPLTWVSPQSPPVISFHGDKDELVPLEHSRRLHTALDAAKVPNQLVIVAGAGHGMNRVQMVQGLAQIRAFLIAQGFRLVP